ncbi:hypothetical protein [Paludisphaera soli]|uniref:hypothetical protein n=1 Tax=Paludisphaera soli TaxID=2712865 RepID=UPI0013EC2DF3|nr:hypothetical protein [Paludisphaera soli]
MMSLRLPRALPLIAVLLASLPACAPTSNSPSGAEPSPVEQVGQLLRTYQEQNKPAPKSLKDAEKLGAALPRALEALRSGEVVIYWGVNLDEYGGASVIGYEKDVPEKGGVVILGDGSTTEVTAEAFQGLPKPPASKLNPSAGGKAKGSR